MAPASPQTVAAKNQPSSATSPTASTLGGTTATAALAAETVLARSGNLTFTMEDLREAGPGLLRFSLASMKGQAAPDLRTTASQRRIAETALLGQALTQHAEEAGASQDPQAKRAIELALWQRLARLGEPTLINELRATESTDTLYRESWAQLEVHPELAPASDPTLQFRFIFIRTAGLAAVEKPKRLALARQTLDRVRGGEDFGQVLMQVSEAQRRTTEPLTVAPHTQGFSDKLYRQLKALPTGAISEIVESPSGYNIFQIVSRRESDRPANVEQLLANPQHYAWFGAMAPRLVLLDRLARRFQASALPTSTTLATQLAQPTAALFSAGEGYQVTSADLTLWNQITQGQAFSATAAPLAGTAEASALLRQLHDALLLARAAEEHTTIGTQRAAAERTVRREIAQAWIMNSLRQQADEATSESLAAWLATKPADLPATVTLTSGCNLRLVPAAGHATAPPPLLVQQRAEELRRFYLERSAVPKDPFVPPAEMLAHLAADGIALQREEWQGLALQELEQRGTPVPPAVAEARTPQAQPLASDLERTPTGYRFSLIRVDQVGASPALAQMPRFARIARVHALQLALRDELLAGLRKELQVTPQMTLALQQLMEHARH